jgi:hypothetical protein
MMYGYGEQRWNDTDREKKGITRIIRFDSVNEENIKHPVSALMSKGWLKVPDSESLWFGTQQRNHKT